jgi:alpha-L-fucosidase
MMSIRKWFSICAVAMLLFTVHCGQPTKSEKVQEFDFEPTGESLKNYEVPQWYEDAKFGIYFHWAPFSVAAYKTEWYPHWMYSPEKIKRRKEMQDIPAHHVETWGDLDKFG